MNAVSMWYPNSQKCDTPMYVYKYQIFDLPKMTVVLRYSLVAS